MAWFLGSMGIIALLVFAAICIVDRLQIREGKDLVFHEKMERFRMKWDPKITFFENLFMWIFVLAFIYFIYLG
jgi:Ca2+/Na+ antiporter